MIDGLKAGAIFLFTLFMLNAVAQAQAPKSSYSGEACLKRLSEGRNRFKAKLPLKGLRVLKRNLDRLAPKLEVKHRALFIDYSKSSIFKRSYIVDFRTCDLLTEDYVAHGGAVYTPKYINWADPDRDGVLNTCMRQGGNRTNMTRPGLFVTRGCHVTRQKGWPKINKSCHGVKLYWLQDGGSDSKNHTMVRGVVLHEHVQMKNNTRVKPMGQGCPIYAPGELKKMLKYGVYSGFLVYLYVPQCAGWNR